MKPFRDSPMRERHAEPMIERKLPEHIQIVPEGFAEADAGSAQMLRG